MIEEVKKKIHIRNTDFFLKNFRNFGDDFDKGGLYEIIDVELECLGYGVFDPKNLLDNFFKYIFEMLRVISPEKSSIRSLKITLNGFTLDPSDTVLQRFSKELPKIQKNLVVLWVRTSNLKNVTLKDFSTLLHLSNVLSDINFEDFTLECANWTFTPRQPNFRDLRKIFESLIMESIDITRILNRHFRLEMSGWYYTPYEAKAFLGLRPDEADLKKLPENKRVEFSDGTVYSDELYFKELERFFSDMERLVQELMDVMDNIVELELDMRNMHSTLKMGNLKKRLDNLSKENRYEKSLISKRNDSMVGTEGEKELRLNIVM